MLGIKKSGKLNRVKDMKTILCYGDSNTWGFIPGSVTADSLYIGRYSRDIRWTGQLQRNLGNKYHIIEEGLNARTTNLDYSDFIGRNGKTYLYPCVYSHAPVDLIVLMLGANDLKSFFNRSASDIAMGMEELIQVIQSTSYGADMLTPPKILLIGYPIPSHENAYNGLFKNCISRAKELISLYKELAARYNCYFLNAEKITPNEIDGLHFDEKNHKEFALMIAEKIKEIFS